jgi:hypothetical protein
MRLQLVVTLALVSSAFAQRNPIHTNGNMPVSGIPSNGGLRAFGPGLIPLPNPGALPPASPFGPGKLIGSRFYAAYGAAYDPIYDSEASFDGFYSDHADSFDPFYSGLSPDGYALYQAQPEMPTPSVVINEGFRTGPIHPQLRDYSNVRLPEPGTVVVPPSTAATLPTQPALTDGEPIIFLIALQDHVIVPAIAYWVQGNTLHYISLDGAAHQVSLAQIDRDFSKQLNRERNLPFPLPAATLP